METERMRYETFIRRSHGYVGRGVGGADADNYDTFDRLLSEIHRTANPTEQLKKDFYIKLGEVRGVLDAAISIYQDQHFSDSSLEDRQALTTLCNEIYQSEGDDIIDIVDRGSEIYDRIESAAKSQS